MPTKFEKKVDKFFSDRFKGFCCRDMHGDDAFQLAVEVTAITYELTEKDVKEILKLVDNKKHKTA